MMFGVEESAVLRLGLRLRQRGERLTCAESCTGGLLAAACTAVAGSSDWFDGGWVSYSNAAKQAMLGVDPALIDSHGAVSQPVAEAMVEGALHAGRAQWAVAVTGIAGPGGAVAGKPVGTVWLAWGRAGSLHSERLQLSGDRSAVRESTVRIALERLQSTLDSLDGLEKPPPLAAPAPAMPRVRDVQGDA